MAGLTRDSSATPRTGLSSTAAIETVAFGYALLLSSPHANAAAVKFAAELIAFSLTHEKKTHGM